MNKFEGKLRESLSIGVGYSWYPYWTLSTDVKVKDLFPILRRAGFQNANYKKELKPTNKACRKILKVINSDKLYIMKHPNGTKCYIGWHFVEDQKQMWVRVVGLNEIYTHRRS